MIGKLLSFRACILSAASALSWVPQTTTRLALGWVFVQSGWGKLHNLENGIGYFESLGIPVPLAITMVVALLTAKRADIATASDLYGTVEERAA